MRRQVLITGAAGGMGEDTALRFLDLGDMVIACDRDEAGLEQLKQNARGRLGTLLSCRIDLADAGSFGKAEGLVRQTGRLDVLIHCAGICSATPLAELSEQEWDRTYDINVKGPFFLTQRLLPYLAKTPNSCIVQVSSMAGYTGSVRSNAAYSSSKAALSCMTKNLAKYCADMDIRVNEVSPGTADTKMTRDWLGQEGMQQFEKLVPLGRLATAGDISGVVVFLASGDAGFITGQSIQVNGGMYLP